MNVNCPSCKRSNDETIPQCECGYVFSGAQTSETAVLSSIDRNIRTIKNVVVAWFIIALVAAALIWIARL